MEPGKGVTETLLLHTQTGLLPVKVNLLKEVRTSFVRQTLLGVEETEQRRWTVTAQVG